MRLAVELYGTVIGTLEGDARSFDFTPTEHGIDRFGVNSVVLSVAIPLLPAPRRDHARRRRSWFSELLPEGDQYDHMLAQSGLRRGDTPGFLARYGRDVAGALQLWDRDDPAEPRELRRGGRGLRRHQALVIERYDRRDGERLHQEDFNQALGATGNEKYQELGGVVSLTRIAAVLTRFASGDDLDRLARVVVATVALGNLDLHAKNIGLLHPSDGEVQLAPAYDVVPQAHQSNDGRLALAVDGIYRHAELTRDHLAAEIAAWGVRRAVELVDDALEELTTLVAAEARGIEQRAGAWP